MPLFTFQLLVHVIKIEEIRPGQIILPGFLGLDSPRIVHTMVTVGPLRLLSLDLWLLLVLILLIVFYNPIAHCFLFIKKGTMLGQYCFDGLDGLWDECVDLCLVWV